MGTVDVHKFTDVHTHYTRVGGPSTLHWPGRTDAGNEVMISAEGCGPRVRETNFISIASKQPE